MIGAAMGLGMGKQMQKTLSGWGRHPKLATEVYAPRTVEDVAALVKAQPSLIARGNGRAYGDSAINAQATLSTKHLNRMQEFDPQSGILVAEAGVLLGDIIDAFLPRGWFPLVTPGTKFVSLGGAIAADVHGKNHHKDGSFRACVEWVEVMGSDGGVMRASKAQNAQLFDHTLGGMGLTGVITRAAIKLRPVESGWIKQESHVAENLSEAIALFEANMDATYSVAWIDCLAKDEQLGRSIVMFGEHAAAAEAPQETLKSKRRKSVPFDLPKLTLNRLTVRAFNEAYYRLGARKSGESFVDWDSYFYPLDSVLDWNRIYGRKGFIQYQVALPLENSQDGLTDILNATSEAGLGSFLAVLKRFGPQESAFSFPFEGYTLALDFPVSDSVMALLNHLDDITLDHGGRFYLAKDARLYAQTFAASEPRLSAFKDARQSEGWAAHFNSSQSERLSL